MLKTAECVTPKHPDKMCDQISDAILDYCLKIDPNSRVAIETMGGHGKVYITGELTMNCNIDYQDFNKIVHDITGKDEEVLINIVKQSPEISQGVDVGGAGDQGIMVGYACSDNEDKIPQEAYLSRSLAKHLYEKLPYDGKTQVTVNEYGAMVAIVASFQNSNKYLLEEEVNNWIHKIQKPVAMNCQIYCNPAGDWMQGGFDADTGLTGRKLAVDNFGPQIPIGGGAFSGKDATKVDRSGAYMARWIAVKTLDVEGREAKEVIVKLAYSIGIAEPVMATVQVLYTNGKIKHFDYRNSGYDLTPKGIIKNLKLKEPIFQKTSEWGHMGNGFEWDK